jgi:anti-anti-sigma regulatory factor
LFRVSNVAGTDGGKTVLKVEGRLVGAWVDELARAVATAMRGTAQVTLDLDGVSFLETRAVQLLRGMEARGVRLVGGSTFVTTLMGQEDDDDDITR